jgi:hypothetical protein
MPAPRIPAAKAQVTGAASKNPQRHKDRKEPKGVGLGKPSPFLDAFGVKAWEGFKQELPWLAESDRALVEIAASVRGRLLAGEDVGITALSMLQSILSKMGGSPADRTKVLHGGEEEADPTDKFFGRSH